MIEIVLCLVGATVIDFAEVDWGQVTVQWRLWVEFPGLESPRVLRLRHVELWSRRLIFIGGLWTVFVIFKTPLIHLGSAGAFPNTSILC